MSYIAKAIKKLKPTAEFSYNNDDYSTVNWDVLDGDAPTLAEINATIEQIKADELAKASKAKTDKAALLIKLGITEDEARLLLS